MWSVSQLTTYLRQLIESDVLLQQVEVRGEISNFKRASSGHLYFSLKDESSVLSCVCFRGPASALEFQPEEGQQVLAYGSITVYEPQGRYQLMVVHMRPDGLGELHRRFEQLKSRLEAEGLFAPERKRALPRFPRIIALCTSSTGAAVRDMTNILSRRFPLARILIVPTVVQGDGAPASLVAALQRAVQAKPDVIIIGRGGGSLEDLWAFNEEVVARAIFACPVPVVSAVGHETDVTISDLVADLRAPTPSAAAELVVPEAGELQRHLRALGDRARAALTGLAQRQQMRLTRLEQHPIFARPETLLAPWMQRVDEAASRAREALGQQVQSFRHRLERRAASLKALDPREVLGRGYAICQRVRDGVLVTSIALAPPGERVEVTVRDGALVAETLETIPAEE